MSLSLQKKKDLNILVVDDSALSRKIVVKFLEEEGFNVVGEVDNGEKAVQMGHSAEVNLFIIDLVMPGTSGLELARFITENFKNVQFIMMSSLLEEHIVIEAIGIGAKEFLHKPIKKEELLKAVYKIQEELEKDE